MFFFGGRGDVIIKIGVALKGARVSLLKIKWRRVRRFFSRIFLLSPKVMAVHHLLLPHPFLYLHIHASVLSFSFPLLEWENVKAQRIMDSLSSDPVDVTSLRHEAATKGGLLCNELRKKVWPKLLGINTYNIPPCELTM